MYATYVFWINYGQIIVENLPLPNLPLLGGFADIIISGESYLSNDLSTTFIDYIIFDC